MLASECDEIDAAAPFDRRSDCREPLRETETGFVGMKLALLKLRKNSSPTRPFMVRSFASKSGSMMSSSVSSSSSPSASSSLSSPLGVLVLPLFGGSVLSNCFCRYSNWRFMSFGSELSAVGARDGRKYIKLG